MMFSSNGNASHSLKVLPGIEILYSADAKSARMQKEATLLNNVTMSNLLKSLANAEQRGV